MTIHIDDHFQDMTASDVCGFDIFVDVVADLEVTLIYDASGLIVRQIEASFGNGRITVRSPDTGKSYSYPFTRSKWDFGSGAVVGSDVIVSETGVTRRVPGLAPDAGLFRFRGVVTGFDEFGIPRVTFVERIARTGNREDQFDVYDAICAALGDP